MRRAHRRLAMLTLLLLVGVTARLHLTAAETPQDAAIETYRDPDALLALLSKHPEPCVLVDVRTADEYASGHIPTAINIPYDVIGAKPPTTDTAELIVVYCASGRRSAMAAATLTQLGYTRVVDFGPLSRWKWALVDTSQPGDCPCRYL